MLNQQQNHFPMCKYMNKSPFLQMMTKKIILISLAAILAALFGFTYFNEKDSIGPIRSTDKDRVVRELVFGSLKQAHFSQPKGGEWFSQEAFNTYLKRLDPTKRFLLQEDVDLLASYRAQIYPEFTNYEENPLFEASVRIMDQRTQEAKEYYTELLKEPFDYTLNEYVELDGDKRQYCQTKEELKKEWYKYLKYSALVRYEGRLRESESAENPAEDTGKSKPAKSAEQIEAEVREELLKNFNSRFDLMSKVDHNDRLADYINSVIALYDPHTEFYPPEEKENFDINMSGKFEGIGASLQQADGIIKVARIIPGSASWKQGQLKEEDVILKVGQGDGEAVSVTEMPLKDAVRLIRGPKGSEVRLTVRKPDGQIVTIPIIRDEVVLEETYAKSAVVVDEATGKKVGLIDLPSFYAEFGKAKGRHSADDVLKEIRKLKAQGVEGIILDLRNNGGGSLGDAIKMAGFFIDKGPVVQVKTKEAAPQVLSDDMKGIEYDGPLVVMVNHLSASASEIVAAALQDYQRAVVVGSNSTYGKGTVQRFIELDNYVPSNMNYMRPIGSVKLTIQKFYRISGKSTQEVGVTPDVILPDSYDFLDIGERKLPYVMPWDEIKAANYAKVGHAVPAVTQKIAKESRKRVSKNQTFALIEKNALRLKEQSNKSYQTLNLEEYRKEQAAIRAESEKFKELSSEATKWSITPLQDKSNVAALDSVKQASADNWVKVLKKDIYLQEGVNVLTDLINLKN